MLAVDGVDGSGKTSFARALASSLTAEGYAVVLIHADQFLNLRAVRYRRGRESPEGFWLDSYDYRALQSSVIDPFRAGGNGRYREAATSLSEDCYLEFPERQAPADSIVIIEGMFLHRDELAEFWDFSIFLDAPFTVTAARMALRDGSNPDPEHPSMRRYVQGQRLYFAQCEPWHRASLVIDNSEPQSPRLLDSTEFSRTV
ncbi:uridine kinase [Psychromicrobium lacuslunae]|uniref:Uridine kinase n=1 Tax=Psychromicrobium lacuslunae TaxID=1618207 RepID=A0A0D4C3Z2_9MICC|nr:uridine kinase [Psychromicrobium lacuslunae]